MNRTTPLMKSGKYMLCMLMLAFMAAGLSVAPAQAQDDQAYKKEFNAGLEAYQAKKVNEAYTHWEKAAQMAKQAGDNDIAQKALSYVTQLDYARGINAYKKEAYEEAIKHFEKGLQHDPTYAKHHYGKGLALKKLERMDEAMAAFQQAAASTDSEVAQTAKDAIRDQYIFQASSALARNGGQPTRSDAQEALTHLEKLQEVTEPNSDVYYYMAEAYKTTGDYARAIEAADQGLEIHRGSKTDKAKLYFVKGEALMNQGNIAAAKSAFNEARYGSYKAPAEHYIETL